MLVDHDVEADLVAQRELVEIAIEKPVPDLGVEIAVRQNHSQRATLQTLFPSGVVGHFREVPDTHGFLLLPSRSCRERPKPVRQTLRAVPNAGSGRPAGWSRAGLPGSPDASPRH